MVLFTWMNGSRYAHILHRSGNTISTRKRTKELVSRCFVLLTDKDNVNIRFPTLRYIIHSSTDSSYFSSKVFKTRIYFWAPEQGEDLHLAENIDYILKCVKGGKEISVVCPQFSRRSQ